MSCVFQGYVVCPSEKRFLLLFTFLKKNRKKKLMVFFSSCMSVKFHYELLNYIDLPVMAIHVRRVTDRRASLSRTQHLSLIYKARLFVKPCFLLIVIPRASRSRPNVPPPSSSSATLTQASCCALTWPPEAWTSLRWTGLSSTTPQMTPRY